MTSPTSTVLALDIGGRRIGVAVADTIARLPRPLITVDNSETAMQVLASTVREHQAVAVVAGLPRGLEGQETDQTRSAQTFGAELEKHLNVPLFWQDEALTSVKAEEELEARRKPYTKGDIDALASVPMASDSAPSSLAMRAMRCSSAPYRANQMRHESLGAGLDGAGPALRYPDVWFDLNGEAEAMRLSDGAAQCFVGHVTAGLDLGIRRARLPQERNDGDRRRTQRVRGAQGAFGRCAAEWMRRCRHHIEPVDALAAGPAGRRHGRDQEQRRCEPVGKSINTDPPKPQRQDTRRHHRGHDERVCRRRRVGHDRHFGHRAPIPVAVHCYTLMQIFGA